MKVAYIAHPVGGDVEGNLRKLQTVVRHINLTEPNTLPFCPYYLDCVCLDDSVPKERERGIRNDNHLLKLGFVDEIRLYGDCISNGMMAEVKLCESLGIMVVPMTIATAGEYRNHLLTK